MSSGDSESTADERVAFGEYLASLRARRGLSRAGLSERSGLTLEQLEAVEHGRVSASLAILRALAGGLGLLMSELFEGFEHGKSDG